MDPRKKFVVGIDPGFASIGIALVELGPILRLVDLQIVETKPRSKKEAIYKSDDNVQRAQEIANAVLPYLRMGGRASAVCAEWMSHPRNASAATKVGMCWGVIATLCQMEGVPILQCSPQDVKRATTGLRSASKDAVMHGVKKSFGEEIVSDLLRQNRIPSSKWEHPIDAAGVVLALQLSPLIQALSRP